ncbi:hypothetical protein EMCRGX_G030961 [Ephydatia muelleri]|eukprot:Em0018g1063a
MYVETDIAPDSERRSISSEDNGDAPKAYQMYMWNEKFDRWRRCSVTLQPPCLYVNAYDDIGEQVTERQLQHLQEKWYHSNLSRKEARYVLKDFGGGDGSFLVRSSESYSGKFALSFIHMSQVRHIVIESRRDTVLGVLYSFVPEGPAFPSLCELIEEARRTPLIQNHQFSVKLTNSPPKPNQRWMHRSIKSLSQAERTMSSEQRDGAFFVYCTKSDFAPYVIAYRYHGDTRHNLIVANQHSYTLNNVSAPLLYKLIHYFMENPINGETCLKYPIEERETSDISAYTLNSEPTIPRRSVVSPQSPVQCCGNYKSKQKMFPSKCTLHLSKPEIVHTDGMTSQAIQNVKHETYAFNIQSDYHVSFRSTDLKSTLMLLEPIRSSRGFKLCYNVDEDLDLWKQMLCQSQVTQKKKERKKSCIIC